MTSKYKKETPKFKMGKVKGQKKQKTPLLNSIKNTKKDLSVNTNDIL